MNIYTVTVDKGFKTVRNLSSENAGWKNTRLAFCLS